MKHGRNSRCRLGDIWGWLHGRLSTRHPLMRPVMTSLSLWCAFLFGYIYYLGIHNTGPRWLWIICICLLIIYFILPVYVLYACARVCVCVCVRACIHIYMYKHICKYMCGCAVSLDESIFMWKYWYKDVCVRVCVCVCVCVCLCVCLCVCIFHWNCSSSSALQHLISL